MWGLPATGGGNPDGPLRFVRNPAAVLVRPGRPFLGEGPVVPLTGAAPKDGGAAFADAAAGRRRGGVGRRPGGGGRPRPTGGSGRRERRVIDSRPPSFPEPPVPGRMRALVEADGSAAEAAFEPIRERQALVALAAVAAGLWAGIVVWSIFLGLLRGGVGGRELAGAIGGLACSVTPGLFVALLVQVSRYDLARGWVRLSAGRVERQWVWPLIDTATDAEAGPGDGLIDTPGPWFGTGRPSPVWARVRGEPTILSPPLAAREGAWLRAAVAAAVGRADGRPFAPWLAPADPGAPPHPRVSISRDRRGRTTVTVPLGDDAGRIRWACHLVGGALLVGPAAAWAWRGLPDDPSNASVMAVAWFAAALIGAVIAGRPHATVRTTIGGGRVGVRTGWGPLRVGWSVPTGRVRLTATAVHHAGVWASLGGDEGSPSNAIGKPFAANPGAVMVLDRGPWWTPDTGVFGDRAVRPLTGRVPRGSDGPAFAAAAAGAVAAALIETGWRADRPGGWRFGWPVGERPDE